jgi:hypothetical protein
MGTVIRMESCLVKVKPNCYLTGIKRPKAKVTHCLRHLGLRRLMGFGLRYWKLKEKGRLTD